MHTRGILWYSRKFISDLCIWLGILWQSVYYLHPVNILNVHVHLSGGGYNISIASSAMHVCFYRYGCTCRPVVTTFMYTNGNKHTCMYACMHIIT